MDFKHIPVMLDEVINGLNIKEDGIYLDCTLGGGGHSEEILKRLTTGRLIATDKDDLAIVSASKRLKGYRVKPEIFKSDFKFATEILNGLHIEKLDGVLLDLGISSPQIDIAERGFSYMKNAPLDMRMDQSQTLSADRVVNGYTEEELTEILFKYGEEKLAKRIASQIVARREKSPINTTLELANLIESVYPKGMKGGHPAKRTFQALRIEVNGELSGLGETVVSLARRLKPGGRLAVITFHSLEDRIVKQALKPLSEDCICDKSMPVCVCGHLREINLLTNKPIVASEKELTLNKRAESAKLRIAERV